MVIWCEGVSKHEYIPDTRVADEEQNPNVEQGFPFHIGAYDQPLVEGFRALYLSGFYLAIDVDFTGLELALV